MNRFPIPAIRDNRRGLLAIAALAVLALCLPWTSRIDGSYIPGWYVPGACVTVHDADGYGSLDCTPGFVAPGIYNSGRPAIPGYATDMRVFLAVALVLLVIGRRRGSARLLTAGLATAGFGYAANLGSQSGQLLFAVALMLALAVLRPWPTLRRFGGAVPGQSSTATTSPATSRIRSSSSAP